MAIVKMKKIRLYALRSQKEALLKELMLLGCVEVREPADLMQDEQLSQLFAQEQAVPGDHRDNYLAFVQSLKLLDHYAPVKAPILQPKSLVKVQDFLCADDFSAGLAAAGEIIAADERIRAITSEETREQVTLSSLEPWRGMDIPLDSQGTVSSSVWIGTLPPKIDAEALNALLEEQLSELYPISRDSRQICVAVVGLRENEAEILRILREKGFTAVSFGSLKGTAEENRLAIQEKLKGLADEKQTVLGKIRSHGVDREMLRHCCDLSAVLLSREEAGQKLLGTKSVLLLEGYTPASTQALLDQALSPYDCAWELEDPGEADIPEVPVSLKNNAVTRPLNMVTDMYSLPAYDGVDPNPLMMPFFVLFYGIMMADMGYGLLMMIAGLVVLKKKKPHGGLEHFCELLFECGITTFFMGALTGSFFGDAPAQVAKIINPATTFTGLPALFTPLYDTIYVLIGAMILGFIQIITGMVINFVQTSKNGQFWDALMDQGSWWLLFAGIGFGAMGVTWWVAIAGVAALVLTQGRSKPTFIGKLVGGVASLYDITGYLGDILSYSRLMALMLAGSVIAQVFNTLGAMPGNIFIFIPIFLLGHAINFGLNLLGCYVHDLRLQCLEYFNKFYKDGGRPFKPLQIDPKYVDIAK